MVNKGLADNSKPAVTAVHHKGRRDVIYLKNLATANMYKNLIAFEASLTTQ